MGLNVVLGVLAYRDLLTFQPRVYSAANTLALDAESYMFTPAETAPLIIVLLSLWLVYHRRAALFSLPERSGPLWLAVAAFALGTAIFSWAVYTSASDIQALSLICNLVGALILWRGLPAVRIALVPLVLLLFALPLPSPVVARLIWEFQLTTAMLAGWMLYVLGIPNVVSAEMIFLPIDTYQVIESCSGFRSVQTLSMFAILMSDLFGRGRGHMLCMFVASLPIAFLMNGLRVTTLILNPHSQIHSIHVGQGLVILMGGLILLYLLDGILGRLFGEEPRSWPDYGLAGGDAKSLSPLPRVAALTAVTALMLVALYFLPVWRFHGKGGVRIEASLARAVAGWSATELPGTENDLAEVSFRKSHRGQYSRASSAAGPGVSSARRPEAPIEVFVGIGEHLDRFKTPFSPKNALPGRGWVVEEAGELELEGTKDRVAWRRLRSGARRVISYHWYEEYRGILEESARSFLALDRSRFARDLPVMVVRLSTEIEEASPAEMRRAHARLEEFHALLVGAVEEMKGQMGSRPPAETARLPDFLMWETFFPSAAPSAIQKPMVIGGLSSSWAVA
ncbi:MAG: exosortase/archaeosortase family protein [bacterium]|nr:exosortase/archaeosortase family protein [bacterium]